MFDCKLVWNLSEHMRSKVLPQETSPKELASPTFLSKEIDKRCSANLCINLYDIPYDL